MNVFLPASALAGHSQLMTQLAVALIFSTSGLFMWSSTVAEKFRSDAARQTDGRHLPPVIRLGYTASAVCLAAWAWIAWRYVIAIPDSGSAQNGSYLIDVVELFFRYVFVLVAVLWTWDRVSSFGDRPGYRKDWRNRRRYFVGRMVRLVVNLAGCVLLTTAALRALYIG